MMYHSFAMTTSEHIAITYHCCLLFSWRYFPLRVHSTNTRTHGCASNAYVPPMSRTTTNIRRISPYACTRANVRGNCFGNMSRLSGHHTQSTLGRRARPSGHDHNTCSTHAHTCIWKIPRRALKIVTSVHHSPFESFLRRCGRTKRTASLETFMSWRRFLRCRRWRRRQHTVHLLD